MPHVTASPGVRLSPPQYGLQRRLAFTVGAAGGVSVSPVHDIPGGHEIVVSAWSPETAEGLVNVLQLAHDFGGIRVRIRVVDGSGRAHTPAGSATAAQVEAWLRAAFTGNPLVYGVTRVELARLGLVCMPSIVQFWNDDISTPTSFTIDTAANTFAAVVRAAFVGGPTVQVYTVAPTLGNP